MAKQKKTKKNFNLKYVDYFKLNTYTSKRLEVELENSRWSKVRESDANKLKKLEIAATESENSKDEVKINLAYTNLHNFKLEIDNKTRKHQNIIRKLNAEKLDIVNHIVGDKVYITYLNQVYNLRKESTFEYKGKEYNLQYAVLADNSKEVITLENRLKELLTDLGFIGVYNSNEAYKTFEKYLYSIISNKTGGVFIKAMNKAAYKTLVLDVICEYIKQYSPNHTFNIETGLFETI